MIPVEAEDLRREVLRRRIVIWIAVVLVVFGVAYIWKLREDPINARQAFDGGERLMRAQRYNEAAISFSRTIGLQPKFTEAYFLRGRAYSSLFQWDKAIADFTKLAELQPKDARAYRYRGLAWFERKSLDLALQDATKAIECDPKMGDAYNLRGMVENQRGDSTAAMRDFNTSIELQPNADNYFQRGLLYFKLGQYAQAEADYASVMQYIPDASHPYFARAATRLGR